MSKQVIVVSDLSGESQAKTRVITIGADSYEVDLTDSEFQALQKAVEPYTSVGKKATGRSVSAPLGSGAGKHGRRSPAETKLIKEWGQANGFSVPQRGRLPQALLDAYQAAHTQ